MCSTLMDSETRFWVSVVLVAVVGIAGAGGYFLVTSGDSTCCMTQHAAFDVQAADGVVTVTHESGDALEPDSVLVETSTDAYEVTTDDVGEALAAGDTVRTDIPARDGLQVRVIWVGAEETRSTLADVELDVTTETAGRPTES